MGYMVNKEISIFFLPLHMHLVEFDNRYSVPDTEH
jgi:hypothetical protein